MTKFDALNTRTGRWLIRFLGHVSTIEWRAGVILDIWHWHVSPIGVLAAPVLVLAGGFSGLETEHLLAALLLTVGNGWYDAEPGMHFDTCGVEIALGPVKLFARGDDSN